MKYFSTKNRFGALLNFSALHIRVIYLNIHESLSLLNSPYLF